MHELDRPMSDLIRERRSSGTPNAGHDTTTLTYTWQVITTHPEVESRLHSELEAVLGGRAPTLDTIPEHGHQGGHAPLPGGLGSVPSAGQGR